MKKMSKAQTRDAMLNIGEVMREEWQWFTRIKNGMAQAGVTLPDNIRTIMDLAKLVELPGEPIRPGLPYEEFMRRAMAWAATERIRADLRTPAATAGIEADTSTLDETDGKVLRSLADANRAVKIIDLAAGICDRKTCGNIVKKLEQLKLVERFRRRGGISITARGRNALSTIAHTIPAA